MASTGSHIVNFHLPYLRAFKARGHRVDVAFGGPPVDIPEADGVTRLPLVKAMRSPSNLAAAGILRGLIRRGGYDLVSTHTTLASFFTRLAVRTLRRRPPVACTVHGYLFDDQTPRLRRSLLSGAEKLAAPVTDMLITMNTWDDAFARSHRLGRAIEYVPGMGVDFSALARPDAQAAAALRHRLGFDETDFLVVYAAEFSKRKNQALLIEAAAGLPERLKLLLPGDGALLDQCRQRAAALGLSERVVFPGQVKDMPLWFAAADAAATASRSEGLPFNVMEAMGAGLPVVASAVKGHTDLIQDGRTGLLFPAGDARSCRARLERLLGDPDLARSLGSAAREASAPYALENVFPQVMACYDAAMASGSGHARSSE